ncbi:Fumble domain-containing protein [bacterium]|nr:Fumble domain-containing protein [bacterium]
MARLRTRWSAAVDFGGTLTDVVLRPSHADGGGDRLFSLASEAPADEGRLDAVLSRASSHHEVEASSIGLVAATGGRSFALPDRWRGAPLRHVAETRAIARGGLAAGAVAPALVASLGTGTALVVAFAEGEPRHLVGSGIGGGTLLGLSRLLLGTVDVDEIDSLARAGDPGACDLLVRDILGGGIGSVPADATAAHFGRLGRMGSPGPPARADVAAALVNLVAQSILRLVFEAALRHDVRSILLAGHLLDVGGFRGAILRIPSLSPEFVRLAPDPGFAIARGALEEALREDDAPGG